VTKFPYKDPEKQKQACREANSRYNQKKKMKRMLIKENEQNKIDTRNAENLNYGMKPNAEKPMEYEEYLVDNPEAKMNDWIAYKFKFSLDHKWQNEIDMAERQRSSNDNLRFGTTEPNCLLWRKLYLAGKKSDFRYNHLESCYSCQLWYARHKTASILDLNGVGTRNDNFAELHGYLEAFQEPKPLFPEDFLYGSHGSIFPMKTCCNNCGSPLDKNGKCTFCSVEPDN
jgi:hypothetical protein